MHLVFHASLKYCMLGSEYIIVMCSTASSDILPYLINKKDV